jgi:hypothetical protein
MAQDWLTVVVHPAAIDDGLITATSLAPIFKSLIIFLFAQKRSSDCVVAWML